MRAGGAFVIALAILVSPLRVAADATEPAATQSWNEFFAYASCAIAAWSAVASAGATSPGAILTCTRVIVEHWSD